VWIGRLVAHKRAERLVPLAQRGYRIDVIGRGPGSETLSAAMQGQALTGEIVQHGFLPEEEKDALVARSLLHLNTSQGEGWGLCVLEAAALGVPTVAYDVEGLRDAVRDGHTGWLVRDGEDLADVVDRAVKELADPARRAAVAAACRAWATTLSWPRSTARMAGLIDACVRLGTSRGSRDGAWMVSGEQGHVVAEGPVLDLLLRSGATLVRPATPQERLLATASAAEQAVAGPIGSRPRESGDRPPEGTVRSGPPRVVRGAASPEGT
jgi:hypothetical protein